MGLDMYLLAKAPNCEELTVIGTWRSHRMLHCWVKAQWNEAGRPSENETHPNRVEFELSREHLCKIAEMSKAPSKYLKYNSEGFFYGQPIKDSHERTLKIMEKAFTLKDSGYRIFYDSW
ncbi:hypothetical protein [uncultured Microbulbifer sp.]|uniref:hypothetical protein n=1 Tax=uncultured Microbulbifer sp. TaxID=348147 RepID=UPI00262FE939|nr:hypothetical protein [uncultured Microbulbifer sp.]